MENSFYCAEHARQLGNPLIGTIKPFSYLFLLEYDGTFGNKALAEADIPDLLKNHLRSGIEQISKEMGKARLLLIKNQQSEKRQEKRLFVLNNDYEKPFVRRYTFERYQQLTHSPLHELIDEDGGEEIDYPLYLVCTNGQKDKCCSRFGFPIYRSLYGKVKNPEDAVWQSSHVGGHRFAANVVTLPYGLFYGFVEEDDLDGLIEQTQKRQIYLDKLRGRSSYTLIGQTVDYFIRQHTGVSDINGVEWVKRVRLEGEEVVSKVRVKGRLYDVSLRKKKIMIGGSCDNPVDKETEVYDLNEIKEV
jgi:hypothetical protein